MADEIEKTEVTQLLTLDPERLDAVMNPANGTPFLMLKGLKSADPTNPHTESAEADAIEAELTKASGMGFCGTDDCSVCFKQFGPFYEVLKAKLKAAERRALPDSDFAVPDKAPESGSYPVNDENHAHAALSMVAAHGTAEEQRKVKAKVRAKFPNIKISKMSPGVPAFATETPKEAGHLASGQSLLAGPMTDGVKPVRVDPSYALGGESTYVIPDDVKTRTNPPAPDPNRPEGTETHASKSWEIEVVAKQNWVSLENGQGMGASTPGSTQWEDFDAETLDGVARGLASAARAVDAIRKREMVEAVSGDASDWFDAYQLDCAKEDICSALGLVAALAYHEGAEGSVSKAGRRLSGKSESAIRTARDHLSELLGEGKPADTAGNGSKPSEEENIMATVTKEELDNHIAEAAAAAVKVALKADRKIQKAKMKAKMKGKKMPMTPEEMAEKNANNGGDITAQQEEAGISTHDANDVNSVGGKVNSEYINKAGKSKKGNLNKALDERLSSMEGLLAKVAGRPRAGGPVLDGQARGAFPANEGRQTETVAKADEGVITKLEKELEDLSSGPVGHGAAQRISDIHQQLTFERLRKAHATGQL